MDRRKILLSDLGDALYDLDNEIYKLLKPFLKWLNNIIIKIIKKKWLPASRNKKQVNE